ncbi:hypothetical protein KAJ89_01555 [Candidatus Parcubacteria bacterium]|nr:hypothetical protein [Candidatus Parcubacteria bacterium]
MHVYIYDTFVSDKKHMNKVSRVETRITDLGLNGKIVRLGLISSVSNAIENEIKKGAKTIIAVGDKQILSQAVNAMAQLLAHETIGQSVPLGFIPIGKKDILTADFLGVGSAELACDILSQRRIEILDLGQANNSYFLFSAVIPTEYTTIEIDENYTIEIKEPGEIGVINLPLGFNLPQTAQTDPADGSLELVVKTAQGKKYLPGKQGSSNQGVFAFNKLRIINKKYPVLLDGVKKLTSPVDIHLAPMKISLIIGKNRKF